MPAEFLKNLPIGEEERAKLSEFGAATPLALLAMRKASKDAFDSYLGRDRADAIACELEKLLTPGEAESLKQPIKSVGRFGARLDPLPTASKG
ncbi:MAG: hypothetical protein LAP87_16830 [Acidobacteriia bacterium]|nr:hypothetical protein [Terriglobia bacterium]